MKLSDYVMKFLEEKDTGAVFYLPGGGCMHLLDSLLCNEHLDGVSLLHEQGVAIAAENYAFTSGKTGVALVTTGPGGTNAVTGVLSAYIDGIPCLFLSGQVKTADLKGRFGVRSHGSQEADIIEIVKSITKYSVMVTEKASIRYHLEKAWYEANHGRKGPVWVDIPLDIQGSDIEPEKLMGFTQPVSAKSEFKEEVEKIAGLLAQSRRPVLIAGNGLRGSEKEFYELIGKLRIPVIPTWKAVDLIANDHPLFAGKCGTLGERAANFAMQTSDLVVSLGSRLDFSITGFDRSKWAPLAKKVVVDLDETELYKLQIDIDVPVVGDVKEILAALNGSLTKPRDYSPWLRRVKGWMETYSIYKEPREGRAGFISTYDFMWELCSQIDSQAVLVPASAGTVAEIFYQSLTLKKGQIVRSNHGLGAMGYELPAAIGAQIAGKRAVINVCGDGGMQLNIQELAVIAGRKLPIKMFVINNSGYSSIRNMQRNHFKGRYIGSNQETGLYLPDMVSLARAYGIPAIRIQRPEELSKGVKAALKSEGPFLCDVLIDPDCVVSPRSASRVLEDGRIVSTPLEDLYPFLEKEELKRELEVELC